MNKIDRADEPTIVAQQAVSLGILHSRSRELHV
jgi:hypothetical protein